MRDESPAAAGTKVERERPVVDARLAWLLAIPAGALTVGLILLLGPPLGRALLPVQTPDFWRGALRDVRPEPTEQARYLIALAGAVMVPLALIALAWRPSSRDRLPRSPRAALAAQLAFVAVLFWAVFSPLGSVGFALGYFTLPTIAIAVAVAAAFVAVLRRQRALALVSSWLGDNSRRVRWGAAIIAAGATVIWLLPAIQLDSTIANANPATSYDLVFTFDEGLSVLNGHTPLVDYAAQYGSLWPYVVAIPLHFDDASLGAYTTSMVAITLLAMLAIYGVIRRVCRSAIGAVVLYLPFLATSFFLLRGSVNNRYSFADYFGVFPLRYAGPYFVAFLLARHLSGARPRAAIWVFLAAGFTLLNNGDFGVPALGATAIALVVAAEGPRTRGWWGQLGFEAVAGLLAAYILVAIVTLARTSELPDPGLLFRYARLFALAGYAMLPMPWFGFWTAIYLTFCAALVVATIMAVRGAEDRTSIGMLAWTGIFGLGIGSYYAGRSHPEVLIAIFSAWALAIVLLVAVTTRSIVRDRLRIGPAVLALFVGFGLLVGSLGQLPPPWRSIELLSTSAEREAFQPIGEAEFIAALSEPGEPVVLLMTFGQRISRRAGVDDLMPYSAVASMPTRQQLTETLGRLRDAGGTSVFLRTGESWPQMTPALEREGFRRVAASAPLAIGDFPPERILKFSDAQPLP